MKCGHTICIMKRDINTDPAYVLGASFFSGFLFSTWSWGILYLISFLVLYEIAYYIYCYNFNKLDAYGLQIRIGVVSGTIMGFLMGRCITGTDNHEESIQEFKQTFKKYNPF